MEIIILGTVRYGENYFNSNNEAPYPKFSYKKLENWEKLTKKLPLPAIGIYIGRVSENCFNYLKIVGMRYDDLGIPYFDFRTVGRSKVSSRILISALPNDFRECLFSSIDSDKLLDIFARIGDYPPQDWLNIHTIAGNNVTKQYVVNDAPISFNVDITPNTHNYLDYIGVYYKKLLNNNLSNNEFEDITASLLKALGFSVIQRGHNVSAAVADGIASFENNIALVYDCKNSNDFVLSEEYKRAINQYVNDEKIRRNEENLYPVFIARGFANPNSPGYHYFSIDSLLYLLYKKLILGDNFSLRPLSIILISNFAFTKNRINIEWPS